MSWANYDDVIRQLRDGGLDVQDVVINTPKPVRVREIDGDREKRGWYWLSDYLIETQQPGGGVARMPHIVGSFGVYHGDDNGKQKIILGKTTRLSAEERQAIAARHADNLRRAKAIRDAEAARAAAKAAACWRQYTPDGHSDYLERKRVGAHGVRFSPSGSGAMAIPLCDARGTLHGLQIIRGKQRERGKLEKEYWPKRLAKQGHFHLIGSPRGLLLIAEGYATAAELHEATGLPVAVAFDAGNLLPVAQALHKAYPRAKILICADDDYLTDGNPGVTRAKAAAFAVNGRVVWPVFPADRGGKKLTDFNDLSHFPDGGRHLVARQIEAALAEAGWSLEMASPAPISPQGEWGERRAAVSVLALDELVERFMPLDDGTGRYVFDLWTRKIAQREQMTALLPAGVRGDDIRSHPRWISRGAHYMDEVGFDPSGKDETVQLNTWRGWQIKPDPSGSCSHLLELVHYLCNNEGQGAEISQWLLRWMAYPLQHPGAKMSAAVIMHGPQGTGKSAVFQTLARIYGDYATVLSQRGIEDKFNADWIDSKLFVLAEEVVTRQEMWQIKNELKELVTGEWVRVNPKNFAAYRQRNQINICYLSNEGQPLPLENDDRRHLVVWTPPMLSEAYYDGLWQEIDNGGAAALYHYLLNLDLGDFHPKKRPPMTRAKQDLIDISRASEDRFLQDWQTGDLGLPFCPCGSDHLYAAYTRWCRSNGVRNPRESNHFLGKIKRLPGWQGGQQRIKSGGGVTAGNIKKSMVIPADDLLAAAGTARREDQYLYDWLTEGFLTFKDAVEVPP